MLWTTYYISNAGYDARAEAIGMDFQLEPSFLKDGIGFDGLSFEIGTHTHGSVMIVVPYKEILPYMEAWARKKFGFTEGECQGSLPYIQKCPALNRAL